MKKAILFIIAAAYAATAALPAVTAATTVGAAGTRPVTLTGAMPESEILAAAGLVTNAVPGAVTGTVLAAISTTKQWDMSIIQWAHRPPLCHGLHSSFLRLPGTSESPHRQYPDGNQRLPLNVVGLSGGSSFRGLPCRLGETRRCPQRLPAAVFAGLAGRNRQLVQGAVEKTLFCGLSAGFFAGYSPGLLAVSVAGQDDLLIAIFKQFSDWAWDLNPIIFNLLVRTTVMLSLAILFLWLAFYRGGSRSPLLQALILMNSVILGLVIPVERLSIPNRLVKAWVLAVCIFITAVGPSLVPLWLAGELGNQARLRRIAYFALLFLLIGSLLRALPPWTP